MSKWIKEIQGEFRFKASKNDGYWIMVTNPEEEQVQILINRHPRWNREASEITISRN